VRFFGRLVVADFRLSVELMPALARRRSISAWRAGMEFVGNGVAEPELEAALEDVARRYCR
jgi:hypothetical protein